MFKSSYCARPESSKLPYVSVVMSTRVQHNNRSCVLELRPVPLEFLSEIVYGPLNNNLQSKLKLGYTGNGQ